MVLLRAHHGRQGFDVILGNPPWNKLNLEEPGFLGSFDLRFLEADTASVRKQLRGEYRGTAIWKRWEAASAEEDSYIRTLDHLYPMLKSEGGFGQGDTDIFAPFLLRGGEALRRSGLLGFVIPSAFHTSQSLAKLRRHFLKNWTVLAYFVFENRRELFEIHASWKFAPAVLMKQVPDEGYGFPAQFYLLDPAWLFADEKVPAPYEYPASLIERMDSQNLVFQEFRSVDEMEISGAMHARGEPLDLWGQRNGINLRRELDATDDRWRIDYGARPRTWQECSASGLVHHMPGTIHQFTDLWFGANTGLVRYGNLKDKRNLLKLAAFYRAGYRVQARATDERTSIYALLPPGTTATNSIRIEGNPDNRPNSTALGFVALSNSFTFDWGLRLRVGSKTVSKFMMSSVPVVGPGHQLALLAHSALRLTCNHAGYEPLWREQVGDAWREDSPPFTWPVLAGDDERWAVRAAIDAVVADAYGLSRDQYEHVLGTFSHASYRAAPRLCLERFDELKSIGLEAFTRKYDPYWDIPLNENLPAPVIDLPIPEEAESAQLTLWEERDGQLSLNAPGPLFEDATRRGGDAATRREEAAADSHGTGRRATRSRRAARAAQAEPADERTYEQLLGYLRTQGTITSADAQELLRLTAAAVRPLFARLVADGHARAEGNGRGRRYTRSST